MATVVTRSLSLTDRFDKVAIKVNPEAYEEKWGILEVSVTNYSWGTGSTGGDYGFVDLRPPQYNEDSDVALLDNVDLETSGGDEDVTLKYYIAVNNGVPGPAAFVQPDGSWDLLHLKFELPEDNAIATPLAVTLTYTVTFTDLTPVSNPSDDGTLSINVNNSKTSDSGLITQAASTYTNKNGYVRAQINDLHLVCIDRPVDPVLTADPNPNDSVPMFTVANERATVGFGKTNQIINHPCSKVSGTRTYKEKLMIFAINDGKADGNATNVKASTAYVAFMKPVIQKIANWPCDDWVSGTVDYALDFTEVA